MDSSVTRGLRSALPLSLALWAAIIMGANWYFSAPVEQALTNPQPAAEHAGPA